MLIYAVENGDPVTVEMLVRAGARVDALDQQGLTALAIVEKPECDQPICRQIASILKRAGAK